MLMREKKRKVQPEKKKLISLRRQIMGLSFWFCVIIAVAWFIGLAANIRSFQKEQDEKRFRVLNEYAEVLDNSIVQLNEVVGNIFMTDKTFENLNQYKNASEEVDYIYNLLNLLQIQVNSNKNLSGLFVYYDNMEKVLYYMNEKISFSVKEELKKAGKIAGTSDTITNAINTNTNYVTSSGESAYYSVLLKKTKAAINGCISLNAGLPSETDNIATYGVIYNNQLYRTSGEDRTLTEVEISSLKPGKNWLDNSVVYVKELGKTNMAVIQILSITPWLHMHVGHMVLGFLGVVFIILAVRLNRLVSIELTRPLEDMNHALAEIEAGDWKVHFDAPNRVEEIENVRNAVKVLLKEIEQYKIRSYEEQLEKQEAELQYLQLQLAPHFYTNCLKNAYYMLMLKEYENVEKYLMCLSTHLRYLLQKNVKVVELEKERDFVLNYIELQKLMTEKTLTLDLSVDENALGVEVPILLLQTFVENSIKYGRETEQKDLKIQIRIRRRKMEFGDCLDIHICDNGHGYPEEILSELNRQEVSQEQKFGVGVINLQHRMKIYYGEKVSWYFYNADGASSDLIIPVNGGNK